MMEIILGNISGGLGNDDDMTDGGDLDYTIQKLTDLALQRDLTKPFRFIILPKETHFTNSRWPKVMAELWLIDKNDKVITTNKLVWK